MQMVLAKFFLELKRINTNYGMFYCPDEKIKQLPIKKYVLLGLGKARISLLSVGYHTTLNVASAYLVQLC